MAGVLMFQLAIVEKRKKVSVERLILPYSVQLMLTLSISS